MRTRHNVTLYTHSTHYIKNVYGNHYPIPTSFSFGHKERLLNTGPCPGLEHTLIFHKEF
jgi:hypothetical protein